MPRYIYKVRQADGKLIKGTVEAFDKGVLIDRFQKMGYVVTYLSEAGSKESIFDMPIFGIFNSISTESMIMFNIQLSCMINSGLLILDSLNILSKQIENKKFKEIVSSITYHVEVGEGLHEALARHPKAFPKLFVDMVRAGEASGKLGQVLKKYADFIQYQLEQRQKIKGALFYPAILLCAGILVSLFIVTYIVPQFVDIFNKTGVKIPMVTSMLYYIGTAIKRFWYLFILLFIGLIFVVKLYIGTETGRLQVDSIKLKLPVFGALYRKAAISRFAKTLSTLISSGVDVLESLNIVKEVTGNEVLKQAVEDTAEDVKSGRGLSESLKQSRQIPLDVVQMIAVGEQTGNLPGMLDEISGFYDLSLDYTIKKLTTLIEPILLAMMGVMVGFIMLSILLPVFDMVKLIRH